MGKYTTHLDEMYKKKTFTRKIEYINYNFIDILNNLNSEKTVLEIGPGKGEFVKVLNARKINKIDLVDNDISVLNNLKTKFKIRKIYKATNLNFISKKKVRYDLIIMIQVLEHLPLDSHSNVVNLLYRKLNQNGHLIIVVPNANNPLGIVERYGDIQHVTAFSEQSLKDLANQSNIGKHSLRLKGFEIPPVDLVNIIRIIAQKTLHIFLKLILIINGGVFFSIMTPNICLIIQKKQNEK